MTIQAEIIPDNLHRIMPAKGEKGQAPPTLPGGEEYRSGLLLSPDVQLKYLLMKKLLLSAFLCAVVAAVSAQKEKKFNDTAYLQPLEVVAVRAGENAPFAKTDLTKKDIEKNNLGQDLPFLLNQTPSVVVTAARGA